MTNPFKDGDYVVYNPKKFYKTYSTPHNLTVGNIYNVIKASTELVTIQDTRGIKLGMWTYKVFDELESMQPKYKLVCPTWVPSSPEDQQTDGPKTSDGGSSTYYNLPPNARDVDDLIEHKDMNYRIANIFKACYRYGEKAGTSQLYDLKKIMFFAQREVERLERTEES